MLLGIDVGGTFTDAVIVDDGKIKAMAKAATTHEEILKGIVAALDLVLEQGEAEKITRVVISSTIVTNSLTEGKTDPVFLAVMTGPGMSTKGLFPVEPYQVQGYVDHRGKVTQPVRIDINKAREAAAGKRMAAVSGKFAVRNQENERELVANLSLLGFAKIFIGSEISGELNFVRRTNSAYFSAAVYNRFKDFEDQIKKSLKERHISAPVQILKADGGTLPLEAALESPVEAVFTGPAASVLGIEAINPPERNAISLDVGGTTTDIAFWEKGKPLLAKKGAKVAGYNTSVRAFHMRSVGIGGDSAVTRTEKGFAVGPARAGKAMALGGEKPTLSDALITVGRVDFGDKEKAEAAIRTFCRAGEDPVKIAGVIVDTAVQTIAAVIVEMLHEWSIQPVYKVDDIMAGSLFVPELLIGVGGGAPGLIHALGEKMHLPVEIPKGAMVANAIGAALARPTLAGTLRADTTDRYYMIPEGGIREKLPSGFGEKKAKAILAEYLREAAGAAINEAGEPEVLAYEFFRTIHDYYSTGEIIYLKMQLAPGILYRVEAEEVAFQ